MVDVAIAKVLQRHAVLLVAKVDLRDAISRLTEQRIGVDTGAVRVFQIDA